MKRILLVLTVALLMAAMIAVSAVPAFAKGPRNINAIHACNHDNAPWFCQPM